MGNLQGQRVLRNQKWPPIDKTVETVVALRERILQFWDETVLSLAMKESTFHNRPGPACMLVVGHGAFISDTTTLQTLTRVFTSNVQVH